MFLNEKACKILIALRELGQANITSVARAANANVGHTSNTLVKAMLQGYVERERVNGEVLVKLTRKGVIMSYILEEALEKIEKMEAEVGE